MINKGIKREDGSAYLDMLIGFFIWIIIATTVVPPFMSIQLLRKQLLLENEAKYILTNEMIKGIYQIQSEKIVVGTSGTEYRITVEDTVFGRNYCINYQLRKADEKNICQSLEING